MGRTSSSSTWESLAPGPMHRTGCWPTVPAWPIVAKSSAGSLSSRAMKVLGMLSGTSADAIDVALADIDDDDAGHATLRPLRHAELPWPDGLGGHILDALPPARMDRKSTRLNSSHVAISYAVFCLKKKK